MFKKKLKIIGSLSFISLALAIFIIANTPLAYGYELDIYSAMPLFFWITIFGSIIGGVVILARNIKKKDNSSFLLGFLIILLSYFVLLLLPFLRGYMLYGYGDYLTHVGYTVDIAKNTHLPEHLFYPGTHLFMHSLSSIIGESFKSIGFMTGITLIIFSVYSFGLVVLGKFLKQENLMVLFGVIPFFSTLLTSLHTSIFSLVYVPLIIAICLKRRNKIGFIILLILLGIGLVIAHPVSLLFVIFIVAAFLFYDIYKKEQKSITYLLLLLVCFFAWYMNFSVLSSNILRIKEFIFQGMGISPAEKFSQIAASGVYYLKPFHSLQYIAVKHGAFALSFLITIFLIIFIIFKKNLRIHQLSIKFIVAFFVSLILVIFLYLVPTGEGSILRILRVSLVLSCIINALLIAKNSQLKKRMLSFTVLLIMLMSIFSVLNLYNSPLTYSPNVQVTAETFDQMNFYIKHSNSKIPVSTVWYPKMINRFGGYFLGRNEFVGRPLIQNFSSHFQHTTKPFGNINTKNFYLFEFDLLKKRHLVFPNYVRYTIPQYTEEDFNRLKNNRDLNLFYTSEKNKLWYFNISDGLQ